MAARQSASSTHEQSLSILVTGGAGAIGSRLVQCLLSRGHRVRALVLPGDPLAARVERLGCSVVEGDVSRPVSLEPALAGIHTVYHLAAALLTEDATLFQRVNVEGTRNIARAAVAAKAAHLIHVSSASVVYPQTTHYSRSKRQAEEIVRQAGLPFTVVRPTLVYERGGGLEYELFARWVRRLPVVLLIGSGRARKNPVHVADLVDGLCAIAGNPLAHGKTYDLCGGEELTLRELAQLILRQDGQHKPIVALPFGLCRLALGLYGRLRGQRLLVEHTLAGLSQDAALDPTLASLELGYRPVGISEGISRA